MTLGYHQGRILIAGCRGQLGTELCGQARERGLVIGAVDRPDFDIRDKDAVENALAEFEPDIVINAAAYTSVDGAESDPERAFAVNRDGPAHLASACAQGGRGLIHISTDYVFNGMKQGFYLENDPVDPGCVYGQSKASGEKEVRNRLQDHIILRTSWLYSAGGQNFVHTMLRLGRERESLKVVNDQWGCPTCAADLAEAVLDISSMIWERKPELWGTYHYCGKGKTTWYGFALKIFEKARAYETFKVCEIIPVHTDEFPASAKRPANSAMDCSLLMERFGIGQRPWEESLACMLEKFYGNSEKSGQNK